MKVIVPDFRSFGDVCDGRMIHSSTESNAADKEKPTITKKVSINKTFFLILLYCQKIIE